MAHELVRRDPLHDLFGLHEDFDHVFRDFFRGFGRGVPARWADEGAWAPTADVEETEDGYVVTCDVPGLTAKDVNIALTDNVLAISGERKSESTEKKKGQVLAERRYGSFSRSFLLPATVDAEKIKAAYKNGVLTVSLPKRAETKPKSIEIKVE